MNDCWTVLGLDASADERSIKRQYARLLKVHRPDADPEGFQRLREAYEAALRGTRHAAPPAQPLAQAAPTQWQPLPSPTAPFEPAPPASVFDERCLDELCEYMADGDSPGFIDCLDRWLAQPWLAGLDQRSDFQARLMNLFNEQPRWAVGMWDYCCQRFGWGANSVPEPALWARLVARSNRLRWNDSPQEPPKSERPRARMGTRLLFAGVVCAGWFASGAPMPSVSQQTLHELGQAATWVGVIMLVARKLQR